METSGGKSQGVDQVTNASGHLSLVHSSDKLFERRSSNRASLNRGGPRQYGGMDVRIEIALAGVVMLAGWLAPLQAQTIVVEQGQTAPSQVLSADGDSGLVKSGGTVLSVNAADEAFSLLANGQALTIENGGTIASLGDLSFPVFSQGIGNSISNDGQVLALGDNSAGIATSGNATHVNNGGRISMQGAAFDIGILSTGSDTVISNDGGIDVQSQGGIGILALGPRAVIRNDGTISANAAGSFGVISDAPDARIFNSGNIFATGSGGTAIIASGDNALISNSGGLYSDLLSTAVIVSGDNSTLKLDAGTRVQGDIAFVGLGDSLVLGRGLNTALTMTAWPDFIDTRGMPAVVAGDTIATIEPAGLLTQSAGTAQLASIIQQTVHDHAGLSPARSIWLKGLGSSSASEIEGLELRTAVGGWLAGADMGLAPGVLVGAFGGSAVSKSELKPDSQQSVDHHFVGGVYSDLQSGDSFAELTLAFGASGSTSKRLVVNNTVLGGLESADADVDGRFINPSATIGQHVQLGQFIATPMVTASYNAIFLDGFAEQVVTAPLTMGDRRVDAFGLRAQMQFSTQPYDFNSGTALADFRFGVDGGLQRQRQQADVTLMGQGIVLPRMTQRDLQFFAGAGYTYVSQAGLMFRASGDAGVTDKGQLTAAARLGVAAQY